MKKQKDNKPIVLFPILAQPPHIGHLIMLNHLLKIASKVIIVIQDKETVMTNESSLFLLNILISNYKNKKNIGIISSKVDFSTITELPKEFTDMKAFYIATASKRIYANLSAKGYPYLIFLKQPMGFDDFYESVSYLRSVALYGAEKSACILMNNK